jgi:hypothetical protein
MVCLCGRIMYEDSLLKDFDISKLATISCREAILNISDYATLYFMLNYRMAAPLVDGLIRNKIIPSKSLNAPKSLPTFKIMHSASWMYWLSSLAAFSSYKMPKVKVCSTGGRVPREGVYDSEFMRNILTLYYSNRATQQWFQSFW